MRSYERRRIFTVAAVLGAALLVVGCAEDDYLGYQETLTVGAGNASAANRAIHTIDPWPRAAANQHIPGNGPRLETVMETYEAGPVAEASDTTTSEDGTSDGLDTAGKTTE
ncbi:MAG: hypothetical protein KDJ16_14110 [Hyphomicrobiales bacterium]|nr:hypothetical protein [Hyphomicrobiales bacterium]